MDKLIAIRAGGAVQRYHTIRTLRPQSVAEHSWGVAMLLHMVAPSAPSHVLSAALTHDLAELVTGDLPATFKWVLEPAAHDHIKDVEKEFNATHGWDIALTPDEQHLLKWCDMMELVQWAMEELDMGNKLIIPVINNGLDYLRDMGHPNRIAQEIYNEYEEAFRE